MAEHPILPLPADAAKLQSLAEEEYKATLAEVDDDGADVLHQQCVDLACRIWRSPVRSWADVAARAVVVEYHYRDGSTSDSQTHAVAELLLAIKVMSSGHETAEVRIWDTGQTFYCNEQQSGASRRPQRRC